MRKKAIILAMIAMLIFITLPVFVVTANGISVTYSFDEAGILCWLDTGKLAGDLRVENTPSEPLLLYKVANILLPPYADVLDVSVQATLGGQHVVADIPCGQPACIVGQAPTVVDKDPAVYNSDALYPRMIHSVGSIYFLHGYHILPVRLYPVQYKPASKLAIYYTEITVSITLSTGNTMGIFRQLPADRAEVEASVDNPATLATYDAVPATVEIAASSMCEYLIITTANLSSEFQVLACWKAKWVNGAYVQVVNNNASDTQIKNVILNYYVNNDTSFVLLGGDTEILTNHSKYCDCGIGQVAPIAEDYWFANLEGDENISSYDVYIGRAPVINTQEAATFVNKVIMYEEMAKPTANLFTQTRLESDNVPNTTKLAQECMKFVPSGYTNYTLFEENGGINQTMWINFWRNPGIMCEHIGHGRYNLYDINFDVNYGEVWWHNYDVSSLDNTFWPVHTSIACHSGELTNHNSLAKAYTQDPYHGAIACFMNDNWGIYDSLDATLYSGDFIEMQFKALYQDGFQNIGAILARSKWYFIDEATNFSNSLWTAWDWCFREINLIGDPESPVLTQRPAAAAMKTLTDGYFYVPKSTTLLKIAMLFNNSYLAGDQTGGTSPYGGINNWPDGRVSEPDVVLVTTKFGTKEGQSSWDYMADVCPNKQIDMNDLVTVMDNWGKTGTYINITSISGVTVTFNTGLQISTDPYGYVIIPPNATSFTVKCNATAIGATIVFK